MRHAYWAAVSFTDYNVGRVLDALDAGPYRNTTIVVLWGDHGWQLGDNNLWSKMTCFEHATRIHCYSLCLACSQPLPRWWRRWISCHRG